MDATEIAHAVERPSPQLFKYYVLSSLLLGPLFFLPLIPLYFRYHTMRYRFDHDGISMRWGILFRREINLTYSRIQDIHLTSNLIERWLGLARIQIQTASGSSGAEMTLEGIPEFEMLRDYLYSRMRGAVVPSGTGTSPAASTADRVALALHEVTGELREIRILLTRASDRETR